VIFTPEDTKNYLPAQAAVSLTVTREASVVSWPTPAPVTYGTALGSAQLNATASIPGKFVYSPEAGELLAAGTHTLSVTFTPADTTDYAAVQATVSLTVAQAKPVTISWPTPAAIAHGNALGATELNATAPIPGKFLYSPAVGEVLATGTHTLSVTFTPEDRNLPAAQASVSLIVTKATPTITWSAPVVISYGTALGAQQLNATASVSGRFVYTPAVGEVLPAGTHLLSATFAPADTADAATAQATVQLTVAKATPIITWMMPEPIPYGTALSARQLNATALIPGTFSYTPGTGTVLTAGAKTLSAIFTPTDGANYTTAQSTVSLLVEGLPNIASLMPEAVGPRAVQPSAAEARHGAPSSSSASSQQNKQPETRFYKGATYEKGADGQWYLQKK
jgi:hypothetical protein